MQSSLCSVVIFAAILGFSTSVRFARNAVASNMNLVKAPGETGTFDYVVLSMSNRAGFCWKNNKCVAFKEAHPPWTIRGLWPSSKGGDHLVNCEVGAKFNLEALEPVRKQLEQFWPSFVHDMPEKFWEYVFDKHGTCAIHYNVGPITDALPYFKATLGRSATENVTSFLEGVEPDDERPIEFGKLESKLWSEYHHRLQLVCENQREGSDILQEIRLCFNQYLQSVDCPVLASCTTPKIWYLKNRASSVAVNAVVVLVALFATLNIHFLS